MSVRNLVFGSLVALGLFGCSTKTLKEEKLREVKRVAIIGFDLQRQKPVSGGDLLAIALKAKRDGATPRTRTDDGQAEVVYSEFAKQVWDKTKWTVIPLKDIRSRAAYQKVFKSKTEGFQNRPIVHDRFDLLNVPGLLDSFAINTLPAETLKELQADLGVDAIVAVTVEMHLNNNSVFMSMIGQGKMSPFAQATIFMQDARNGERLWLQTVKGEEIEMGEKNLMGMANEAKLNQTYNLAAKSSFEALLKETKVTR
jgi:hypothetical protein